LNVENAIRYKKTAYTFCNIYAYDFCYLCEVFLPRVWWSESALISLSNGGQVDIRYGETVFEIRANELFQWLKEFGSSFGWRRVFTAQELQTAADQGYVGVVVANTKNHDNSGHICVVVPQTDVHTPVTMEGEIVTPVMSDAGLSNHEYYSYRWWTKDKYSFFGFWINDN